MFDPKTREIAIQAISARARGTPVEVAQQIILGVSALDYPGKPFVVWPTSLPDEDRIAVLELEINRIRHASQAMADFWKASRVQVLQVGSDASCGCPDTENPALAFGGPAQEAEAQPTPGEAAGEAVLHLEQRPDREASDASQ
ncbi:hypothetical protein ACIQUS_25680 [Pseudomonas sp. NPDC090755]|uniref:hypothetical protein n=1 Tax=Pseudomonas sp. NPDC090755 TaxID=3364481 RepID=UPI00383B4484